MMFVASGCAATVEMASVADDRDAKTFSAPPGKASIYIIRRQKFFAEARLIAILIDGIFEGPLAVDTYHVIHAEPGSHIVGAITASMEINAEPGQVYFIEVEPVMGWTQNSIEFTRLDDDEGRQAISVSALAEDMLPAK